MGLDPNLIMVAIALAGILGGALTWFIDVRIDRAIDRSEARSAGRDQTFDERIDRLERRYGVLHSKVTGKDPDTFGFPAKRNG